MARTVGVVDCSVTVVIEELLAVATNQRLKVRSVSNMYGPVLAYQLDSLKNPLLVSNFNQSCLV